MAKSASVVVEELEGDNFCWVVEIKVLSCDKKSCRHNLRHNLSLISSSSSSLLVLDDKMAWVKTLAIRQKAKGLAHEMSKEERILLNGGGGERRKASNQKEPKGKVRVPVRRRSLSTFKRSHQLIQ